jgi:hypothetical protein
MHRRTTKSMLPFLACSLLLLVALAGCKKDEKQSGISGTVSVTGGSADGVEVMVFSYPNVSAVTVWRLAAYFPVVGFPFNPSAGFDWRTAQNSRQAAVVTGGDGKFDFPNLSDGDYLLVAHKTGFGWTAPRHISVQGSSADAGTLTLYPEETIPDGTSITENTRWLTGHHYIIQRRAILEPNATLTIEPGAVVRFGTGGFLLIYGTLQSDGTPDAYIRYTSDVLANPNVGDWTSVNILAGAAPAKFRYCTFDYSQYGISTEQRGGVIEYCYFTNLLAGGIDLNAAGAAAGDSLFIQRNVIEKVQIGIRAVNADGSIPCEISHNMLAYCYKWGMECNHLQQAQIYCNYMIHSGTVDSVGYLDTGGLNLSEASHVEIAHNALYDSWRSIWCGSYVDSSVVIRNNRFDENPPRSIVISIGVTDSHRGRSFPAIHNNGLVRCYFTVFVTAGRINTHVIDATNNYWGTTDEATIRLNIIDHDDDPSLPQVLYNPWLDAFPDDAGLCTE